LKFNDDYQDEFELFSQLISNNVKKYRIKKGYTQEKLSLDIGHTSTALISKAENGTYNKHFNIEHIFKISKVLDVPVEKFFIHSEE
jgi:DNA-binding XRE family transcriptional regulator